MEISKEQIDNLNAVVKVAITKEDYEDKVNDILKSYRKQAKIPGFRKGRVSMGLIKKQYGKAVLVDEINKLLQDNLNTYLTEEKLDVLGKPLPKLQENLDWNGENFNFEFELGLAPEFEVKLKMKKPVVHYKIIADKKMVNEQVERFQKQYGKTIPQSEVSKISEVYGTFFNEEENIDNKAIIKLQELKSKKAINALIGKEEGETITLRTKGLFKEDHMLPLSLGIEKGKADDLDTDVIFTIMKINELEHATLDQELFDKLYGEGIVTSVGELKEKIKTDSEKQFEQQSDQKLLNDITERLVEDTKFALPTKFLKKWIQASGEKELSDEEATDTYEAFEKDLRNQLIEEKIIQENDLQVQFEELKEFTKEVIRAQITQYGQMAPEAEELEDITARLMGNEDKIRQLSGQLMGKKLVKLYKEKANIKVKEVTYENFVKEVYR